MKPGICHSDVPISPTNDEGNSIREAASQSCGFHQGQGFGAARAELERRGGPESVVRDAVKRIERGDR